MKPIFETLRNGFLNIKKVTFKTLPKEVTRHEWEYLERGDSVTILTKIEDSDNFIVIKQFRIGNFVRNSTLLALSNPSGMIDEGETPYQAAARELNEEIGCDCPVSMTYLGKGFPSPGGCSEVSYMFLAVAPKKVTGYSPKDKSEGIEVIQVSKDWLEKNLKTNGINSLQMQATYFIAKEKGLV